MELLRTRPSLETSEDDCHDDTRLLSSSSEEEGLYEGQTASSAPRQQNVFALWTILLLCLVLSISQGCWLIGGAIHFNSVDPYASTGASVSSIWHGSFDIAIRSVYPREQYEFTGLGSQVTDDMFMSFDPDKGVVALPKGQPNVLPSKEFPWDETKEVYVLAGYHSLHSLKELWSELHKLGGDKPLSAQVLHSLNVLWQDTLCAARTDPMTIGEIVTDRVLVDKFNQTRQCRDWRDLEQFHDENPACFQSVGEERKEEDAWAEWEFCPEGSSYQAVLDRYLAGKQQPQ